MVDWLSEDTFMAEFFSLSLVAAVSLAEGTGCRGEQEYPTSIVSKGQP